MSAADTAGATQQAGASSTRIPRRGFMAGALTLAATAAIGRAVEAAPAQSAETYVLTVDDKEIGSVEYRSSWTLESLLSASSDLEPMVELEMPYLSEDLWNWHTAALVHTRSNPTAFRSVEIARTSPDGKQTLRVELTDAWVRTLTLQGITQQTMSTNVQIVANGIKKKKKA